MTCVAKRARSIGAETSPVKAPLGSGCRFWAPSFTIEPSRVRPTASSAVNGGHTTMSTSGTLPMSETSSAASAAPSAGVLFIFQLPAMSFLRNMGKSSVFEIRHAGEHLALKKLEARAAASGAVGDLVRDLEFLRGGRRVAPADHRGGSERRRLGDRGGHRLRRPGKFLELEHARRPIPDDRLRAQDGRAIDGDGLRAGIEALPAIGNARDV